MRLTLVLVALMTAVGHGQQPAPSAASPALDYEYFKTKVQPIFLTKRPGHARCIACHGSGTPLRFQPLPPGSTGWDDSDPRAKSAKADQLVDLKILEELDKSGFIDGLYKQNTTRGGM